MTAPKKLLILISALACLACAGLVEPVRTEAELEAIAQIYLEGDAATAADELRAFLEAHPEHVQGWIILGNALLDLDRDDEAREAFETALGLDAERPEALTGLGIVHRRSGDLAAATEVYRRAVAIDPDYAEAWSSLAVVALQRGLDEQALAHAERAYALRPGDPSIVANLATAYHYNDRIAERDEKTREAEALGYNVSKLEPIYSGEMTIRR